MSLTEPLDRILTRWAQLDPPVVPELQPGLDRDTIDELTRHLPFALPEEVYRLYAWHNGTVDSDVFPFHYLLDLKDALWHYEIAASSFPQTLREWKSMGMAVEPSVISEHYFPLFFDAGGGLLVIPCSLEVKQEASVIAWDVEGPQLNYQSIRTLIETVAACHEQGAFYLKYPELGLSSVEIDEKKFIQISRNLNPDVRYWE